MADERISTFFTRLDIFMRISFAAFSFLMICAAAIFPAQGQPAPVDETPTTAIRQVIEEAYCNGAYNALDTRRMAQGFHPDFAILGADGVTLERYSIKSWIAAIEARKVKPGFDPSSAKRTCQIVSIDVTASVAMAKVTIQKADKLQYTDYLSLIKFNNDWKIVAKVYAEHQ
jgi:Putative lumazine-binding